MIKIILKKREYYFLKLKSKMDFNRFISGSLKDINQNEWESRKICDLVITNHEKILI